MRIGHRAALTALTVLSIIGVGACAEPSGFPTGQWQRVGGDYLLVDFQEDGRYVVVGGASRLQPQQLSAGTWEASGNELRLSADSLCRSRGSADAATYRWTPVDDRMRLIVVRDDCEYRREGLDGAAMTRVDTGATGPAAAGPVAQPAPWWNDRVFYEVFVRSFADSDGDGDGDLRGLIDRLDYLNDGDPATTEDLGVNALWLMPVTRSPSYHGYDATDYTRIEPDYGTRRDFKALIAEAHERGIKVIVDLMLNHTSDRHPWFVAAAADPASEKRDWYVWSATDPGQTAPWGTPAWHRRDGAFYLGLFWAGMPDLNYRNDDVTDAMYDVARFWIEDLGVDGFRLDAVRHLVEEGGSFSGTSATHDWLTAWDDHLDTLDPRFLTVGEVWDDSPEVAPYVTGDEVDIAFEFVVADGIVSSVDTGTPDAFAAALSRALAEYPAGQFAPFLTNHDQDRVMSRFSGDANKARLAATALLTLPGVPFVYYGEEIGMVGVKPDENIRTPMQWDGTAGAGFTRGTPWQPVNGDVATVSVAAQTDDPGSLLSHYRRLIAARDRHDALRTGGLRQLGADCPTALAFSRSSRDGEDNVLAVLNFGAERAECTFGADATGIPPGRYRATDLLTGATVSDVAVDPEGAVDGYAPVEALKPLQALVLQLQPAR
jgi:alpha-amylase